MFEYHVMGAKTIQGMGEEIRKRAVEGWRVVAAYQEVKGGNVHVVVFEREKAIA